MSSRPLDNALGCWQNIPPSHDCFDTVDKDKLDDPRMATVYRSIFPGKRNLNRLLTHILPSAVLLSSIVLSACIAFLSQPERIRIGSLNRLRVSFGRVQPSREISFAPMANSKRLHSSLLKISESRLFHRCHSGFGGGGNDDEAPVSGVDGKMYRKLGMLAERGLRRKNLNKLFTLQNQNRCD